jgi:hypothetical protein
MRQFNLARRAADLLSMFVAAGAAASATREGRTPRSRDLNRLGIDAAAFESIRR